jgi:sn-glycerol 3-phosphate transport system ATP-binding protein
MANVSLVGVDKVYPNEVHAVRDLRLEIEDGEFMVLVGPSGCGKTTALRMVAGLEEISRGTISIGGTVVNHLEPRKRDVAMVFQNYALYPHMTVFDNMAYGLRIRGLSSNEIRQRVDESAGLLGLDGLLDRKPRQLSGGQRQRVAMGRAIVRNPKLFLFDEPLSNLDAKLRLAMRAEIRRLQRRLGVTSLFVTHDQVEAMTLGDRLLVLHQGRPAQLAVPMEVFERPADTYVAGFIGAPTMNFLPAELAGGGTAARLAAGPLIPFADGRRPGGDGRPLIVGIRPEHLEPASDGLSLLIDLIEPLGSETLVHGHLTGGEEQSLVVKLAGPAPAGERLTVRPQPEHLHVFDRASGRRTDPSREENPVSRLAAAGTAD